MLFCSLSHFFWPTYQTRSEIWLSLCGFKCHLSRTFPHMSRRRRAGRRTGSAICHCGIFVSPPGIFFLSLHPGGCRVGPPDPLPPREGLPGWVGRVSPPTQSLNKCPWSHHVGNVRAPGNSCHRYAGRHCFPAGCRVTVRLDFDKLTASYEVDGRDLNQAVFLLHFFLKRGLLGEGISQSRNGHITQGFKKLGI